MNKNVLKLFLLSQWVVIFFIFISGLMLIWWLADQQADRLKLDILENQSVSRLIAKVQNIAPQKPILIDSHSLLLQVDHQAKLIPWNRYTMTLRQIDNHQIQASFKSINFNDFMVGLENLSVKNNIQVKKINIQRVGQSGLVNVEFVF